MRLETFGGLTLEVEGGASLSGQRRRLALLALLAAAGDRGLSRDQLVAYLWPENSSDTARHGLEQLLYGLRRSLGDDLFVGINPLRLNGKLVPSDVAEFERAWLTHAFADVVALHRGPFLQGFFLDDAPEFERWVESERARLAGHYAEALHRLADDADKSGDRAAAVNWHRRLVAADPLSSRSALAFMRALAAAGDRGAALQHARVHELLVRQEFDSALDPAIAAYVDELRSDPGLVRARWPEQARGHTSLDAAPNNDGTAQVVPQAMLDAPAPLLLPEETTVIAAEHRPHLRGSTLRPAVLIAGIVALALVTAWGVRGSLWSARVPVVDLNRILVSPFRVSGDSELAQLGALVHVLLSAQLTGEGGPAAIDKSETMSALQRAASAHDGEVTEERLLDVARALGAGLVLIPELVRVPPDHLKLSARIVPSSNGRIVRASVDGPADSVPALVNRLGGRLLALHAGEHAQRISSLETRSPEALRAFLEGRAEHRRGRDAAARALFARALDQDSTFALAALELALAPARLFRWTSITTDTILRARGISLGGEAPNARSDEDLWNRAMEIAWRRRGQLNAADRALLLALRVNYPAASFANETLAGWERAIQAAPDRAEAHYWYGRVLLEQGLALGLADSRTRAESSLWRAFDLDSAFLSPLIGLVEIAAYERDTGALRHLRVIYLARDSIGGDADYVRWLAAAAMRDEGTLREIRSRFASFDPSVLTRILQTSQMSGLALEDAERAAIVGRTHERQDRQFALFYATHLALNRGQPEHALRLMDLKREVDGSAALHQNQSLLYALMWEGDSAAGSRAARTIAASPLAPITNDFFSVTLRRLWHGDTTGAAAAIEGLRRRASSSRVDLLDALLADLVHRPDAPATLARLDSLALRGCCDQPLFINLGSARLHERAGNLPAALAAVRRGRWFFRALYLSTYLREEGRLATLTGDTVGAINAYRSYLALRSNAEPSLQPAVAQVHAELARLEQDRGRRAWWRRLGRDRAPVE